ncbi:MAG TPA: glutathione peroxidase [Phenylobacterium sp.]|uniref:glutathione peroxidase n=1 Tax=Phenylobacterium sp. TaxID=1871053 RepID=UPI002BCDDE57|nr:glutathione peroxidase [Phenylobacterium sp.]
MADAYDFAFQSIDGGELPLTTFKDKVVLVVNTASKCGLTPQYEGLEKLYSDYRDQGLVVLGVPCNQFMGQEPGTESEIAAFCATTFGVDFPMTAKTDVKGEGAHPFYQWARAELGEAAEPVWNFHKLLVGRDGRLIAAFGPRTEPADPDMVGQIKAAL